MARKRVHQLESPLYTMIENPSIPAISSSSPLLFLHIPKCGGMSFYATLTKHLGPTVADLYNKSQRNLGDTPLLMQDATKTAYCGHFSFGLHQWINRPCYYVSMVREPVSRLVSLYYFLRNMWPEFHKKLTHVGYTHTKTFVPEFHADFLDWFFENREDAKVFFSCPSPELDNGMVRRFSGYGLNPAPCPSEALGKAKDNIEKYFSFVGIVERYSESLKMVATIFRLAGLEEHLANKTSRKPQGLGLPPDIISKISAMNPLDLALYDWINKGFDARTEHPKLIAVLGLGRKDYRSMPLWKGVGGGRNTVLKNVGI
jgi:hypothetical protein